MKQEEAVLAFGREHSLFPAGGRVLCAVSGGADSVCMLHLLLSIGKRLGFSVAAAHYNHRLRGAESDGDERFVQEMCARLGISCFCGGGDVAAMAEKTGKGIEETAREMRYGFLRQTAEQWDAHCIATAHTADDNAETVLMRLGRGAGTGGLAGIPVRRGKLIRPILCLTRAEVLAYLEDRGIPHREDSTNALDDCTRNRIRHTVMVPLRQVFPAFSRTCGETSELLREDEAFLSGLAADFVRTRCPDGTADVRELAAQPFPVASRAVRLLCPCTLENCHVRAVLALCRGEDPSARLSLPGCVVRREYDRLVFGTLPPETFAPVTLTGEAGEAVLPECGLRVRWHRGKGEIYKSFTTFFFKTEKVCGNITLRPRAEGDRVLPGGRDVWKTVKKLMLEAKIPAYRRGLVPVLADETGVLGVYGLCQASHTLCPPGESAIIIQFEECKKEI